MLERLSELRKERKWSLQETADQLGIAKSTYAGYESGYRLPSLHSLSQIADLFHTSVDYLLGRTVDSLMEKSQIEITKLMGTPEKVLSLDGVLLSKEELAEFIAFVRVKRELK
ncbi:helix-turn-helix transcriptional regulator [Bacillus xiapuensis]|uniref:Helix-turn-helix transcriptional regulator n=1 Tax=Bacillus xiapuensis TaxID=2014075 RepID=A0ABU6ND96_9BACI|nr:helix-turn-helix transcriptional regulator [Bacillus xiapuensis]